MSEIQISAIVDAQLIRRTMKITGASAPTYVTGRTITAHALVATWKLVDDEPVLIELSTKSKFSDSSKEVTYTYIVGGTRGTIIAEPMAAAPAWALALARENAPVFTI